jgi:hypothetical protein
LGKAYSLHLGLNLVDPKRYGGWDGRLAGCENDARDMAAIAKSLKYAQTKVLLTKQATSTHLIEEMGKLARTLSQGDLLLLTYSGHGGQVPDEGSEEDDDLDETWCLYDRQLIDDEIYSLLGRFAQGVRILMLSDSCHSGSVAKMRLAAGMPSVSDLARSLAPGKRSMRSRLAPSEVTRANYEANKDVYLALQSAAGGAEKRAPAAGVILISGCQDLEESFETSDGKNGQFTASVKKIWNAGKFKGGHRAFHRSVASRLPPYQNPNLFTVGKVAAAFLNQKPFTI